MRATVKAAIGQAQEAAQYFGTTSSLLDGMQAQAAKLVDTLSGGVGDLVDADMAKEAAHLQAQQVREQLAYQTLSIANGSAQWILKLFGQG
jgi:flagellin